MTMHRSFACLQLFIIFVLCACGQEAPQARAVLGAVEAVNTTSSAGFTRITEPRTFVFPRDLGPQTDYQTEWWYLTGNLQTAEGRRFGYQLTFFRRGLIDNPPQRASAWAARNIYLAHFTLSDIDTGRFYASERYSRDGAGLAGAQSDPFRVFLEDWSLEGSGPQGFRMKLHAATAEYALDLALESTKPPVLQGDRGVSQKGSQPGNASYYYSLTRMQTSGSVHVGNQDFATTGWSWMDREFGTSSLESTAAGWDWFSLQIDDNRELMFWRIRDRDASHATIASAAIVNADGSSRTLDANAFNIEALETWHSPASKADYPSRWRISLLSEALSLDIQPRLANQELPVSIVYWEGAVAVTGTWRGVTVSGSGYVELTGYAEQATLMR